MSKHTIFMTGATGFIGRHTVRRLGEAGYELRCLVRATADTSHLQKLGAGIIRGDVGDAESLRWGMAGCDWAVHLAATYSFWQRDRWDFRRVNADGTRNVMECALEAGLAKIVDVSTALVWGLGEETPFDETTPVAADQLSEYARTKYYGDCVASELEKKGLPLVVLYLAGVTGPGDTTASGDYIRQLVQRRLPARLAERSSLTYVHVRDVAEAILRALEKPDNVGQRYIIGGGDITIREINEIVRDVAGVALPRLRFPDSFALPVSRCVTWLADRIGRPPPWGMATDQIRTMLAGLRCDGSKAEKELGLRYTPVRVAFEEALLDELG